jgi:hypothetical protein
MITGTSSSFFAIVIPFLRAAILRGIDLLARCDVASLDLSFPTQS